MSGGHQIFTVSASFVITVTATGKSKLTDFENIVSQLETPESSHQKCAKTHVRQSEIFKNT